MRPRKSKQVEAEARGMRRVTIELPEDVCAAIEKEGERLGLAFSQVMRIWLKAKVDVPIAKSKARRR